MTDYQSVKTWPARYKASTLEIYEAAGHRPWIAASEVRKVLPSLRPDKQLAKEYPSGFEKRDKGPRLFFSESALTAELKWMRSNDALMFLAWLEKTVFYPMSRKRDGSPPLKAMTARPRDEEDADDGEDLHIPVRKLPPAPKPLRVRPEPNTLKKTALRRTGFASLVDIWRGESELTHTIVVGGLALFGWTFLVAIVIGAITDPSRYNGHYILKQWVVLLCILSLAGALVWWCTGVMRCALRRHREGSSFIGSMMGFIFGVTMFFLLIPIPLQMAGELLSGWWRTTTGTELNSADVIHDKFLGRIVVKGELGFGTYQKLEQALKTSPKLTLVEIESPGGYVIEGLAMARLIEKNRLDTVSFEECQSACTYLLVAGEERYLGPAVKVGFHRSWSFIHGIGTGWNRLDHEVADYYRSRSTDHAFVQRALDTPGNRMWLPTHGEMFTAGYATKRWDERKSGY